MKKLQCAAIIALALTTGACSTNISPDTYSADSANQVAQVVYGVVISARPVHVEGSSQIGTLTGAAAGGVAGSYIGGNNRAHALGAIGGAILGGIAGSAIEKKITGQDGIEYMVKLNNGETRTLVQGPNPSFVVGQRVMIIYGNKARIVADNSQGEAPQQQPVPPAQEQPQKPDMSSGQWETVQKVTI